MANTFNKTNSNSNKLMGINPWSKSNNCVIHTALHIRNNFVQLFQENRI